MAIKKPKDNTDELMDFLKEDEEVDSSTRVSFELDPFSGTITNESSPGFEKEFVNNKKKEGADVEIDFDFTTDEPPVEVIQEEETETTEEVIESPSDDTEIEAPKPKQAKEDKKPSRSKERIEQLAREKRDALLKAAQLEDTLNKTNAMYAKIQIDTIEKSLVSLKKELQQAVDNQDAEAIADAQSKYYDAYQQLGDFKKFLPDAERASMESSKRMENFEKDNPKISSSELEYPEAAQLWMDGKEFLVDMPTYKGLPVEQRKKLYPIRTEMQKILESLIGKEGYTPDSTDLYDELDMRLSSKFPEYDALVSEGLDTLNSENKPKKELPKKAPSGETTKPRNVEDKTRSVPVKSSSSIGSSESSGPKSTKVKLTKEDVRYWENYLQPRGITIQEYAKQIKAHENE